MLYYILISVPVIMTIINALVQPYPGVVSPEYMSLVYSGLFFIVIKPLYLLFVTWLYTYFKKVTYERNLACMLSAIMADLLVVLVCTKLKTGSYSGYDTPQQLYFAYWGLPCIIVTVGTFIAYHCRELRRNLVIYCMLLFIPIALDLYSMNWPHNWILYYGGLEPNAVYFFVVKPAYIIILSAIYIFTCQLRYSEIQLCTLITILIDFFLIMLYNVAEYSGQTECYNLSTIMRIISFYVFQWIIITAFVTILSRINKFHRKCVHK